LEDRSLSDNHIDLDSVLVRLSILPAVTSTPWHDEVIGGW
jgi:hypothetical protein